MGQGVGKVYWALVEGYASERIIRRPLKDARRKKSISATTRYARLESFARLLL